MIRRLGGYVVASGPAGTVERDTFTCHHCNRVVVVAPGANAAACGGWCWLCSRLICGPCATRGNCDPWEKQMERMEARDRLRRQVLG
jgi:hypothetical protein